LWWVWLAWWGGVWCCWRGRAGGGGGGGGRVLPPVHPSIHHLRGVMFLLEFCLDTFDGEGVDSMTAQNCMAGMALK